MCIRTLHERTTTQTQMRVVVERHTPSTEKDRCVQNKKASGLHQCFEKREPLFYLSLFYFALKREQRNATVMTGASMRTDVCMPVVWREAGWRCSNANLRGRHSWRRVHSYYTYSDNKDDDMHWNMMLSAHSIARYPLNNHTWYHQTQKQ